MELFFGYALLAAVIVFISTIHLNSKKTSITASVVSGLLFGWAGWLLMPTLNFWFISPWLFLLIVLLVGYLASMAEEDGSSVTLAAGIFVLALILVVPAITSAKVFHSRDYRDIMPEPTTSRFADDVSPVDIRQIRVVDQQLAHRLGEKRLGEIPGLGSRVELGTMNIQVVNGCFDVLDGRENKHSLCFENDLVWAGPLHHSGFFKQNEFGHTPGYVLVSATNMSKVYMVTALRSEGSSGTNNEPNPRMGETEEKVDTSFKNLKLQYFIRGGYFDKNLVRHLKTSGHASDGLTDFTFEINDSGQPFWVVSKYTKRVGFSGADAVGVIVVDVQTGDITEYTAETAPEWIDRIHPEEFVRDQLNWQGKYVDGFWNTFFGKKDVRTTTPGMSLVYGADGRSYWYTGIQSVGADEGTMGFMLVDSRTKEPRWYQVAGATETAAKASAENAPGAREAGYQATNPILYNVGGIPTYFMTLKGGDGLVKMYAFVSVKNYETFGVGRSISSALKNYQSALAKQGQSVSADDLVNRKEVEAVVADVAIEDGFYYIRLEDIPDLEFYGSSDVSPELKWTRPGDRVVIVYDEGRSSSVLIAQFDNLEIDIK